MRSPDNQTGSAILKVIVFLLFALPPALLAQAPFTNPGRPAGPGTRTIDLRGSAILPTATGVATLTREQGFTRIHAEFDRLPPPETLGQRYVTYVVWAITPVGDALHLGEIKLNNDRGTLDTTTDLESFALLVTAEPDSAVSQPGDAVVLVSLFDNAPAQQTVSEAPSEPSAGTESTGAPLEFQEAYSALGMARMADAETYAPKPYQQALKDMQQAEVYLSDPDKRDEAITLASEAAQAANDARLIADSSKQEAEYEAQRQAIEQELERVKGEIAQAQNAEPAALQPNPEEQQARQDIARAENEAQDAQAGAVMEESRLAEEREKAAQDLETAQTANTLIEREAEIARATANLSPTQLRAQLQQELQPVLETRETDDSLIASVPDNAFYVNAASLKQETRDMLARVVGVLLAYPGLKLDIRAEGPPIAQGPDSFTELHRQNLQKRRARTIAAYLVSLGLPQDRVSATGTAKSATGAEDQSVELVITGEAITSNPAA